MQTFEDLIEQRSNKVTKVLILCSFVPLLFILGCAHNPTRTITIPTPPVEYSHPVFHPTFEPPVITYPVLPAEKPTEIQETPIHPDKIFTMP